MNTCNILFNLLIKRLKKYPSLVLIFLFVLIFFVILTSIFLELPPKVFAATTTVDLGTVDNFAVLARAAVSDTGTTSITGDVGLITTTGAAITGLTCTEITGTIYDNDGAYAGGGGGSTACRENNAGVLNIAKTDLSTAYGDAAGRTPTEIPTELGGTTLTDGVYDSADGTFGLTGTLTLDGGGNTNSVFIFQMASTLITATDSKVVLTNGAQACNVFWQVGSSATLGTYTTFVGNILAFITIVDSGHSTINGRLLAGSTTNITGAVTLNNTTISIATCAVPSASSTTSSNSTSSTGGTKTGPVLNYIPPIIIESKRTDADSVFISWAPYSGISTFIVQYGLENGNWLYSTNVTGFSTTLNALPTNQPIWVRIAPRDDNSIGAYGETKLVGGPSLPNTGLASYDDRNNIPWCHSTGVFIGSINEKLAYQSLEPKSQISCKSYPGLPVRLIIPSINVNSDIQHLGVTPNGEMEVPSNIVDSGWFKFGPIPGEKGSAVIAGHLNGVNGEAGVFSNLNKLKEGDKLYIENDKGAAVTFVVRKIQTYDPGYAEEVFSLNDKAHLNLITCDGIWDNNLNSYNKRLVIFTDAISI